MIEYTHCACGAVFNPKTTSECPLCTKIVPEYPHKNYNKLGIKSENRKDYFRQYRKTEKWKKYNRERMKKFRVHNILTSQE